MIPAPRPHRTLRDDIEASLKRHGIVAVTAIVVFVGGLVVWSALTEIAGAVIAPGNLVVRGSTKTVQHLHGGIVKKINVDNDDVVKAGQVLVQLDDSSAKAALHLANQKRDQALVLRARLQAEIAGRDTVAVPPELKDRSGDPDIRELLSTQRDLLEARARSRASQRQQIRDQIAQLKSRIEGLKNQIAATTEQMQVLKQEETSLSGLLKKGLVGAARVDDLKRSGADLRGTRAKLKADMAAARGSISEHQAQLASVTHDFRSSVLGQLEKVRETIVDATKERLTAKNTLDRLTIRAPIGGVVHENVVHTVGSVVSPGEVLMRIVPQDQGLIARVRISPLDAAKVNVGQKVEVRFPGLDPRKTAPVPARIKQMSPDLSQDKATGAQYYSARIVLDGRPHEGALTPRLLPGMPVQAFVQTSRRSILSYLVQPIVDQLRLVFREN